MTNRDWSYLKDSYGVETARSKFQKICETLFRKINISDNVQSIKCNPGDEGIDIFIGEIGVEPITVIQCKYFIEEIGDSQKAQIRQSFDTAISSKEYIMKEWVLCLPTELNIKNHKWWCDWKSKQSFNQIRLILGNELIEKLKLYELYSYAFDDKSDQKLDQIIGMLKLFPQDGTIKNQFINDTPNQKIENNSLIIGHPHIIDQLYYLFKKFDGLNVIPPNTLSNFKPFYQGQETAFHYEEFTLYTINSDLFKLFKNIEIQNEKVILNQEYEKELILKFKSNDYGEKIAYVIHRLNNNLVFNIETYNDIDKAKTELGGSLFGYDLNYPLPYLENISANFKIYKKIHEEKCDCIECLYHDLKFDKVFDNLNASFGQEENYDLKYGYVAFKMGSNNYKDAYVIYKKLSEKYKFESPLKYFVACYNLKNLYPFLKSSYTGKDKPQILDYIRDINLNEIIYEIGNSVDEDIKKVLIEIKEEEFPSRIKYKVDELYDEIIKIRALYSNEGGTSGPYYVQKLHVQLALLFGYFEWNYLIGNEYGGVKKTISKIFESLLISQSIEKYDLRLKEFNSFHCFNAIFFLSPKSLQGIFSQHKILEIQIDQKSLNDLINILDNLLTCNHKVGIFGGFILNDDFYQNLKNFNIKQKINEIIDNFLFLLGRTKLNKTNFSDSTINNLFNFLNCNNSDLLYLSLSELCPFIKNHFTLFSASQLEKLLEIWINNDYLRNSNIPKTLREVLTTYHPNYKVNNHLAEEIFFRLSKRNVCHDFIQLVYIHNIVEESMQFRISKLFIEYIKEKGIDAMIMWELFYYKIIPASNHEIFIKYIHQSIVGDVRETYKEPFGGKYKNYTYLNFISLCYLLNIDRRYILSLIPENVTFSPYCEWLLKFDFPEYNYSLFDPEWLLFSNFDTFFHSFKQEIRIKKAIEKSLKKEYNKELGDIYMLHFFNL
jgi:hypothetical protein